MKDFQKVELERQLKPAIAGLIIDNDVGVKEAYATFIHLIERRYLTFRKIEGTVNYCSSGKSVGELLRHEKDIMNIFLTRKKINPDECKTLLNAIGKSTSFKASVVSDASDFGLYGQKDAYGAVSDAAVRNPVSEIMNGDIFRYKYLQDGKNSANWLIFILASPLLFIGFVVFFPVFLLIYLFQKPPKFSKILTEAELEKIKGPKKRYMELKYWLERHPLSDYRWSNEFLPYAVAFGLYKNYEQMPK